MTEQIDEEFDFVVIGSGAGSMCAGLVMRSLGRSVVILEKANLVGGATARSGGAIWVPNNRFMREAGIDDSPEQATAYMDATCGQSQDAPGSTPERRAAYVEHAPEMIDFLVEQGIKFRGIHWPDYYNEYYGASAAGRIVAAEMFDASQLGPWRKKLQPNFVKLPGQPEEFAEIALIKRSWRGKLASSSPCLPHLLAKLLGRHPVINGAALQGRMLRAALRAGVEVRTLSPVSSLIIEDGAAKGVVVKQGAEERQIRADWASWSMPAAFRKIRTCSPPTYRGCRRGGLLHPPATQGKCWSS